MPTQPLSAALVDDPAGGAPRAVHTITPDSDASGSDALRRWHALRDAGKLAYASPPSPDRHLHEARIRETEAILGIRRGGIW